MQETRVASLGRGDPLEQEMTNAVWCSCLGNPLDRGAWLAAVHGVPLSRTGLSGQAHMPDATLPVTPWSVTHCPAGRPLSGLPTLLPYVPKALWVESPPPPSSRLVHVSAGEGVSPPSPDLLTLDFSTSPADPAGAVLNSHAFSFPPPHLPAQGPRTAYCGLAVSPPP